MIAQKIADGVYCITLKNVNLFLLDRPDGCVLIDTGFPDSAQTVISALNELGKKPTDIRHILLTHAHPDHIGSAAMLKKLSGAEVYIHSLDADIARNGNGFRPVYPAPGLLNWFMKRFVLGKIRQVDPVPVDHLLTDGQVLPIAGGIEVIHIPGHCLGQVAFLWPQQGGVLFAADACMNLNGLVYAFVYEDLAKGKQSLHRLSALDFQVAGVGHGQTITRGADKKFRNWVQKKVSM